MLQHKRALTGKPEHRDADKELKSLNLALKTYIEVSGLCTVTPSPAGRSSRCFQHYADHELLPVLGIVFSFDS